MTAAAGDGPQGVDRVRASGSTARAEPQATQPEAFQGEPVAVTGFLDLRDEGYGFLRVNGYLPEPRRRLRLGEADPPVRPAQGRPRHGHVAGRPVATRRTRRCCGSTPSTAATPSRPATGPRFEDLTPLFPDEKLRLENGGDPTNMTARIIDLVSPIGKGQRGLIVSPPKAGKTTIMKTIATADRAQQPRGASSSSCWSTSGPKRSPTCAARSRAR